MRAPQLGLDLRKIAAGVALVVGGVVAAPIVRLGVGEGAGVGRGAQARRRVPKCSSNDERSRFQFSSTSTRSCRTVSLIVWRSVSTSRFTTTSPVTTASFVANASSPRTGTRIVPSSKAFATSPAATGRSATSTLSMVTSSWRSSTGTLTCSVSTVLRISTSPI